MGSRNRNRLCDFLCIFVFGRGVTYRICKFFSKIKEREEGGDCR